jgi:hypothetical protein
MSTARFNTLQNAAGSKSVPVDTVVDGSAKAWVNFNGTGTVAIRAAFNVSSITDNGSGDYTVNFTTSLVDVNYAAVVMAGGSGTAALGNATIGWAAVNTVNSVRIGVSDNNTDANFDASNISVAIFR